MTTLTRHEGWHRALDMQLDTCKWCLSDMGMAINGYFFEEIVRKATLRVPYVNEGSPSDLERGARHTAKEFQALLYRADTCYVTTDMLHVLLQAAHDLPNDVYWEPQMLLTREGFCLFEEPIYGTEAGGRNVGISALAWDLKPFTNAEGELKQVCHVFFLTDMNDNGDEINQEVIELLNKTNVPVPPLHLAHWYPCVMGQPLPVWTNTPGTLITLEILKFFMAFNLVAAQKLGTPQKIHPPRATRRRIEHEWPDRPDSMISLITLRRTNVKHDDEPKDVPWTRRWMVRGHWRKQYYPSTKSHGWKYIYEYIKGPEDKPLILTERRVFNFRR